MCSKMLNRWQAPSHRMVGRMLMLCCSLALLIWMGAWPAANAQTQPGVSPPNLYGNGAHQGGAAVGRSARGNDNQDSPDDDAMDDDDHHDGDSGDTGDDEDDANDDDGPPPERLMLSQDVVTDDMGIGPKFLLAASSSCPFGSGAADDFTLASNTAITRLTWEGVYFGANFDFPAPGGDFRIAIYLDNGLGNIGDLVATIDSPLITRTLNPRPPLFGFHPVYTFSAQLDPPVLIQGGQRYWISINGNPAGPLGPTFGWMVSAQGNAAATPEPDQPLINAQVTCADLPVRSFTPGGTLALDADLAFALYSQCDKKDCNCNGIKDKKEIKDGLASDCNENKIPDECDIAYGFSQDVNGDGIPDECQSADDLQDDEQDGDLDDDGDVDAHDLATLLSRWGATGPLGDINSDGVVDVLDLSILLSSM